jgi:hypothetical protein
MSEAMRYQLQPFNQARFDACMAWIARVFNRTLSQYETVKIHALADVIHVVKHHRPIIGGTLRKLPYGPVDLAALNRSKEWQTDPNAPMEFSGKQGNALFFARKAGPTRESMFTRSEQEAILDAARTVFGMTFDESQRFFHGECAGSDKGYLGRAWRRTRGDNARISWEAILNAYAEQSGEDAEQLKSLVCV